MSTKKQMKMKTVSCCPNLDGIIIKIIRNTIYNHVTVTVKKHQHSKNQLDRKRCKLGCAALKRLVIFHSLRLHIRVWGRWFQCRPAVWSWPRTNNIILSRMKPALSHPVRKTLAYSTGSRSETHDE